MFRLSGIKDRKMQSIISKELAHGFDTIFSIKTEDEEVICSTIKEFCKNCSIEIKSSFELKLLTMKLYGMYKEITDINYEYTFDEHGEWLLYKILEYAYNNTIEKLNKTYPGKEDFSMDELFGICETSINDEELEYVFDFSTILFNEIIEDVYGKEYTDEYEEDKQSFIFRVLYFPFMYMEVLTHVTPEFLFWDRDFMMIEDMGVEVFEQFKNEIKDNGYDMGFSTVTENTQMMTGSEKYSLDARGENEN